MVTAIRKRLWRGLPDRTAPAAGPRPCRREKPRLSCASQFCRACQTVASKDRGPCPVDLLRLDREPLESIWSPHALWTSPTKNQCEEVLRRNEIPQLGRHIGKARARALGHLNDAGQRMSRRPSSQGGTAPTTRVAGMLHAFRTASPQNLESTHWPGTVMIERACRSRIHGG